MICAATYNSVGGDERYVVVGLGLVADEDDLDALRAGRRMAKTADH